MNKSILKTERLQVPPTVSPRPAFLALLLSALLATTTAAAPQSIQDTADDQATATPSGVVTDALEVRVIDVDVFVTDRSGQPVAGLSRDEFELRVDGKVTPIANFYAEAGGVSRDSVGELSKTDSSFLTLEEAEIDPSKRTYVVILIDHTRISANNRKRAFGALRDAMDRLGKTDLVAVVGVEGSLVFYSDFLYDRQAVERILDDASKISMRTAVNEAEWRQIFNELTRGQSGGIQARASLADENFLMSRIRAYAVEEYNRSLGSLRQIETVVSSMSGIQGRKALFYLGEGIPSRPGEGLFVEWTNRFGGGNPEAGIGLRRFDYNSDYTRAVGNYDVTSSMQKLAKAANRAGVTLYSVDAEGNHGMAARSALTEQGVTSETVSVIDENFRAPLEYVSKATGGRLLRSSGLLSEQLVAVLGDFDTFYSLGFTPPDDWDTGSEYDIKVEVKTKKLVVRHREEVRLPEPDEREAGATLAALMYQTADNPLGFRATPGEASNVQEGARALPVTLEIPVGRLELVPRGEAHAGALSIYVTTMNAAGDASRVQKVPFHLAIPDDKIEQARGELAHYPLPVVLRAGDRRVAIGIRDDTSGAFSAVRLDVSDWTRFE